MKATLKFKLTKEKYEFHQAINGWRYASCLQDIWNRFRELEKYGERNSIPIEEIRQEIVDIFVDNNVSFDEL